MMSTPRIPWIKPALFLLIAVGLYWIARAAGVDIRQITPERIRGFVLSFGVWAPLILAQRAWRKRQRTPLPGDRS